MKITIPEIRKLCITVLKKYGLSNKEAKLVFEEYLDGELRDRKCHGFAMFKEFAALLVERNRKPIEIEKDEDCYMLVNGGRNLGQVVCHQIIPKAMKKAKKKGIFLVGIYNMHSYLMPGTYARKVADNDLIVLIFNYGGRARIAPTGSIDPIFGTNPIAVGIPSDTINIVVDMATSKKALAVVRLAQKLGQIVDNGIGIDKNGNPTTDPKVILEEGALLPFGDYKGSALALVIEVLTRCMFDLHPGDENNIRSKRNNIKMWNPIYRGYLFIFINPSIFGNLKVFKRNVSELIKQIKNSRKAKGIKEIFVPGEHSERIKKKNLKKGYLEIDKKIINEIRGLL